MPVTSETGNKGWDTRIKNGTVTWPKTADEWLHRYWTRHYEMCHASQGDAYTLTVREMVRVIVAIALYEADYADHHCGETIGNPGISQELLESASGVRLEKFSKMAESPLLLIRYEGTGPNAKWRLTWRTLRAFERFGVPQFHEIAAKSGGPPIRIISNWWVDRGTPFEEEGETLNQASGSFERA